VLMTKFILKPLVKSLLLATTIGLIGFSSTSALARTNSLESGEAVFEVLASEIALQRGEAGLANQK